MPYIEQEQRVRFADLPVCTSEGELNYAITRLCDLYMCTQPHITYAVLNSIVGVLECAKQEFYRQVAAPYEDKKLKINGPVF